MFEFRRYKKKQGKSKKKHPKLIVDDNKDEYGFMSLTSRKQKGKGHNNIKLVKNPQRNNSRNSYLRKKIEYDKKKKFTKVLNEFELSKEDKQFVIDFINKHKRR